jgi:hypothetical protein
VAYQKGTATTLADLLTQLHTFAGANGWTSDQLDTAGGSWALHKGNVFVSARWTVATPVAMSMHQALGYTGGNQPGTHPNDSGNGYNATTSHVTTLLDDERHVSDIGNGPFLSYHFFEQDSGPAYLHVGVEFATGAFRHLGFGNIEKVGTWTGGEYCYGHMMGGSTNHTPIDISESALLDGLYTATGMPMAATVHCEGLTGQPGAGKWGVIGGTTTAVSTGLDTAGIARERIRGGYRGGPVARSFGVFNGSSLTGLIPMYKIPIWHAESVATTRRHLLGYLPDVRGINIRNFSAGEEVTVGADTYVMLPLGIRTSDNVAYRTYFSGIAYRKETA